MRDNPNRAAMEAIEPIILAKQILALLQPSVTHKSKLADLPGELIFPDTGSL